MCNNRIVRRLVLGAESILLLAMLLTFAESSALAAPSVAYACTEAGLDSALAAGGTATFTCAVATTITVSATKSIAVNGTVLDGGGLLTISGGNVRRVFNLIAGVNVTLTNLTIANGMCTNCNGGGIYLGNGALTITNSVLTGNQAIGGSPNGSGGGIDQEGGTLAIMNSTFSGNSSSRNGGAIAVSNGTTSITHSTFTGNSTGSEGGSIHTYGTMTITNSTFSGNSAGYDAGAIANGLTLTVINSTFSGNSTTGNGNGVVGGIVNLDGISNTVTLYNTIVANSTLGGNCSSRITNGGNNLDSGTTCGWGSTDGSLSNTNPLLGFLANNGGSTQTFALLVGSPAIDRVSFNAPNQCPSTDQRGAARPQGARCDVGAYEYPVPVAPVPVAPKEVPEGDTLWLLSGGIGGLGVWLRYQWSKRRTQK